MVATIRILITNLHLTPLVSHQQHYHSKERYCNTPVERAVMLVLVVSDRGSNICAGIKQVVILCAYIMRIST